jgi:hypothetical protein
VTVEESLDKVVEFTGDDEHLRAFVAALEGVDAVGPVTEWRRAGDRHRHRVEWKTDGYRGWLEVSREGRVASISAGVQTDRDSGMDARLDAALLGLKESIEAIDAADIELAGACPSLVVETVLKGLIRAIPAPQRGAMHPYLERAGQLDGSPALEPPRARLCQRWASELARRGKAGVARLVSDVVHGAAQIEAEIDAGLLVSQQMAEEAEAGVERFDPGRIGEGPVRRGFHTQLNQAYEAIDEAHKVASHQGWDAVPWTALLDLLFEVGPGA